MTSASSETHAARIRAVDEEWKLAAANRDIDGMLAIYADDAQELMPGVPAITGREAIRAFYVRVLNDLPRYMHELQMDEIIVAGTIGCAHPNRHVWKGFRSSRIPHRPPHGSIQNGSSLTPGAPLDDEIRQQEITTIY